MLDGEGGRLAGKVQVLLHGGLGMTQQMEGQRAQKGITSSSGVHHLVHLHSRDMQTAAFLRFRLLAIGIENSLLAQGQDYAASPQLQQL